MSATAVASGSGWSTSVYSTEFGMSAQDYWQRNKRIQKEEEVLWPPVHQATCSDQSVFYSAGMEMFCGAMCYAEDQRPTELHDPTIEIPAEEHLLPLSPIQLKTHAFHNNYKSPTRSMKNKAPSPRELVARVSPDSPSHRQPSRLSRSAPKAPVLPSGSLVQEEQTSHVVINNNLRIEPPPPPPRQLSDHMNEPSPGSTHSPKTPKSIKSQEGFNGEVLATPPSVSLKQQLSPVQAPATPSPPSSRKMVQDDAVDQFEEADESDDFFVDNMHRRNSEPVKRTNMNAGGLPSAIKDDAINRHDRPGSDPMPPDVIGRPQVQRAISVDNGTMLISALRTPNSERIKKRVSFSLPEESELVSYSERRRRSTGMSPRQQRNSRNNRSSNNDYRRSASPQRRSTSDNSYKHHRPQRDALLARENSRRSGRSQSSPSNSSAQRRRNDRSASPKRRGFNINANDDDDEQRAAVVIPVLQKSNSDDTHSENLSSPDLTNNARLLRGNRALFDSPQQLGTPRSASFDTGSPQQRPSLTRRVSKTLLNPFRRNSGSSPSSL